MMLNIPAPALIEWTQDRLVALPLEVDLVDLLTELEHSPDDPELHDLFDTYFYYTEM